MLMAGVHALASLSPALSNPEASLLPDLSDVRDVSVNVAAAVVRQAVEDGNAQDQQTIDIVQGKGAVVLEEYIKSRMWDAVSVPSIEAGATLMRLVGIDHWNWSTEC